MEANREPEKLYLISDEDGVYLSYDPPTKSQGDRYNFVDKEVFPIEEGTDIEYTRTDAFIEKAKKWIEEHEGLYEAFEPDSRTYYTDIETMVKDFENYMNGSEI